MLSWVTDLLCLILIPSERLPVSSLVNNHVRELRLEGNDLGRLWSWPEDVTFDMGLDYDIRDDMIYWSTKGKIMKSDRKGTGLLVQNAYIPGYRFNTQVLSYGTDVYKQIKK